MRTLWTWKCLPGEGIPFMKMRHSYDCLICMMGNLYMKDGLNIEWRPCMFCWLGLQHCYIYFTVDLVGIWLNHCLPCVQYFDWLNLWNKKYQVFLSKIVPLENIWKCQIYIINWCIYFRDFIPFFPPGWIQLLIMIEKSDINVIDFSNRYYISHRSVPRAPIIIGQHLFK